MQNNFLTNNGRFVEKNIRLFYLSILLYTLFQSNDETDGKMKENFELFHYLSVHSVIKILLWLQPLRFLYSESTSIPVYILLLWMNEWMNTWISTFYVNLFALVWRWRYGFYTSLSLNQKFAEKCTATRIKADSHYLNFYLMDLIL